MTLEIVESDYAIADVDEITEYLAEHAAPEIELRFLQQLRTAYQRLTIIRT